MVETLILHGGGPKTGSSYLQHVLAMNTGSLLDNGVLYPQTPNHDRAQRGDVTSGNGVALASFINRDLPHQTRTRASALDRFSKQLDRTDASTVVLSSEFLALLPNQYTEQLCAACATRNIRLLYLFYVRDLSAAAYSAYCQGVKRHGETRHLTEFIRNWSGALYLKRLRDAEAVLPRENILCYNYDSLKHRLAAHLFEDILQVRDYTESGQTVNRSLSFAEAEFLRSVNQRLASDAPAQRSVTDILLQKNRPDPKPVTWTPEERDIMEHLFAGTVEAINRYVTGEPVRALAADATVGARAETVLSEWDEIVVSLFAGLAEGHFPS